MQIRNDSDMPTDKAIELLADGVELTYGGIALRVQTEALEHVRRLLRDLPPEKRHELMTQVDDKLQRLVERVRRGDAPSQVMDRFFASLLYWTVLNELSGV
jgi:hypothetical protein